MEEGQRRSFEKTTGFGAFLGMVIGGLIGLPFGAGGLILGGLFGALIGNELESESVRKKKRRSKKFTSIS